MKMSTEIKQITPAFLKAQKKIESVIKDATNPFFKSKYADLTSVIDACKDKLNAEGIAILQPVEGMAVETVLIHESGEWFSSSTPVVVKDENNPQALGSAITYAKRYGLQSMVLLPAEDDDGNRAVKAKPEPQTTTQTDIEEVNTQFCEMHEKEMKLDKFGRMVHWKKEGNSWYWCQGHDWKLNISG